MPRAIASVLGAVLLVGVTVLLAVALTVAVTGFAPPEPAERVVIDVSADAATGWVSLEHTGGPPIDARALSVRVEVDGEPLAHQPPVPFHAATGFKGFPTGPFNPSSDPSWSVGETAAFRVAKTTNEPSLTPGATLSVSLTRNGKLLARATAPVE